MLKPQWSPNFIHVQYLSLADFTEKLLFLIVVFAECKPELLEVCDTG